MVRMAIILVALLLSACTVPVLDERAGPPPASAADTPTALGHCERLNTLSSVYVCQVVLASGLPCMVLFDGGAPTSIDCDFTNGYFFRWLDK